jgi:hypothetical protein
MPVGAVTRSGAGCALEIDAEPVPAGPGRITLLNETDRMHGSTCSGSPRRRRSGSSRHSSPPLHHIGVGHVHKGKRLILLMHGLDVRVISQDGELLRHLTLDPTRDYQPQGS